MMNIRLSVCQHLARLALLVSLALLVAMSLLNKPALAQDPDFSAIDDPLDGQYELFAVDDLLIQRPKGQNSSTETQINNYVLETNNETISSQTKLGMVRHCYLTTGDPPQHTRVGRFFALPYDVIVTLLPTNIAQGSDCTAPDGAHNMALHIQSVETNDNISAAIMRMSTGSTSLAMADFTGDGYEDLLVMSDAELFVATAMVITDTQQGFVLGPKTEITPALGTRFDPATGDFNGDGLVDVAWIGQDYLVRFATVCPGAIEGTICATADALTVLLNPLDAGTTNIVLGADAADCVSYLPILNAITAGQFTSTPIDQLITVDIVMTGETTGIFPLCGLTLHRYEFDGTFSATEIETVVLWDKILLATIAGEIYAQSARLGWFDDKEQAVIALGSRGDHYLTNVYVASFANDTTTIGHTQTVGPVAPNTVGYFPWVNGIAIGRFAAVTDNPSSETDFNQQIAVLTNNGAVDIYGVNNPPTDVAPTLLTTTALNSSLGLNNREENETTLYSWLVAGDLQGRSARLGAPSVIRLSGHFQPSVILGAPPMHVDYILPDATTSSAWEIVNFSVIPEAYNSQYTMSQTDANQSSNTNKTSYTYATTEKTDAGFSLKPPYVPSISGSIKTSTTDKSETVSSNYAFQQNEFSFDVSTETGFGDEIWYDQSSFNLYLYPVLGKTVCPADNSTCSADEEQPLYLMFSGPNSSGVGPAPGATTEWYQPVHEPGNLFSYPWNETQLRNQIDSIAILSSSQHFFTDDSTQTQHLSWSTGSGQTVTAGSVNSHSHDKSYSLTAGKTIGTILDVNLSGNIDYNNSSATSTLNQSTSSIGASQGIAIAKPGAFLHYPLYQYRVEPYIFGRTPSPENVEDVSLSETIQTYGPLQAVFAANPVDSSGGSWWRDSNNPYRQDIDVALNHPVRWSRTNNEDALNCLENKLISYCVAFNDPNPSNLWNSEFYWMRGLFVTVGGLAGPQRVQATEGDDLFLTARVYNYSLKDMAADSTIKVRFYRQEMNGTNPTGDSVLIDEVAVAPLPGFNSDSHPDTANWTTASASFDTTGLGAKTFIFWVVVWVEDSTGAIISELPGHGLSAKPDDLTAIGDVPLAEVTLDGVNRTFSNNVGYLHALFYIAPADQLPKATPPAEGLSMSNVHLSTAAPALNEQLIVSATIETVGGSADGVAVHFYSGDPDSGARSFDVEFLPHIEADKIVPVSVPFRPAVCGEQEIAVVARTAQTPATRQSVTITVPCPPLYLPTIFQQASAGAQ